jgi:hypothetical protein
MTASLGAIFVLLRTFEQLADAFVTAFLPFYFLAVASNFPAPASSGLQTGLPGALVSGRSGPVHGGGPVPVGERAD